MVSRAFTCLLNRKSGAVEIQIALPHTPLDFVKPHVLPLWSGSLVTFRTFC